MLVAPVLSSDVNDFTVKRNVALPSQRILAAIPFVALKRQSRCRRSNVPSKVNKPMVFCSLLPSDVKFYTCKPNVAFPGQLALPAIPFVALKRQRRLP